MATRRKKKTATGDARTRFLIAAEQSFAAHGYDGTSIRAIAEAAGANLATLTHYWGSKRSLFKDLFERRFRALADNHVQRMQQLVAEEKQGKPIALRDLLRTLIEPPFVISAEQAARLDDEDAAREDRRLFHLLYGRALTDPSEDVVSGMNEIFAVMTEMFFRLLRQQRLDLNPQEFYWRVVCASGVPAFAHAYAQRLSKFFEHEVEDINDPQASERILNFVLAGMSAPAKPSMSAKRTGTKKVRKGARASARSRK